MSDDAETSGPERPDLRLVSEPREPAGPPAFAVELLLDADASAALQRVRDDLVAAGLQPPPRADHPPHVSLAVCGRLDAGALEPDLARVAAETHALRVSFGSLGIFPTTRVLHAAPVPAPRLLEIHARVQRLAAVHGSLPWEHYLPGKWVPHATLAEALPPELWGEALRRAADLPLPLRGVLVALGVRDLAAGRELARLSLLEA